MRTRQRPPMKILQELLTLEKSVNENKLKLSVRREAPAWQYAEYSVNLIFVFSPPTYHAITQA